METNDFALIQRVLGGDDNAFTVLVNRYQKTIHTFVWRKIGDFHTAEELTQDIFLKAYKKLSLLKPPYHFSGWLYVIATRRCIAWMRKKQEPTTSLDAMPLAKLEELSYTTYEATGAEAAGIERQRALVKRLLQKLPESERTVVTMHYLAEMPCEKISEFLGVSPNTVKSRLHRARQRLKTQEHLLHDVSAIFQVPPTLTANIMREVARLQPTVPSTSKPWVPWGFSFASTCLILLMIGVGTRALYRFQQPYSLDATSEMTIEFVEAPVVLPLQLKLDVRNQFGNVDTLGKNSGAGQQPGPDLLATLSPKEADAPSAKPQWVQTGGTGEVSNPGLFLAADQSLYAVTRAGLYRFTPQMDAWTLVSASGPKQEFNIITEYRDTLYLLTSDELLVSTDKGKTWRVLGSRPEGRAVALVITDGTQERKPGNADTTMYLVLRTEVFRSEDAGSQWEFIGHVLRSDIVREDGDFEFRIWDALAVDNTLFVGTSRGLFRLSSNWKKMPVPTSHGIRSLAIDENRLYVGTTLNRLDTSYTAQVFYSTDLGDSWTDITPNTYEYSAKMGTTVRVVPVGKKILLISFGDILCSYDAGETWRYLGNDRHAFGASPTIALDKSNFYRTYYGGITRSMDGGDTWHPFVTGIANFNVQNLSSVKNVLCGVTSERIIKSKNGGQSWETLNVSDGDELLEPKIQTTDTAFYVSSVRRNRTQLFHLSISGDTLVPLQDMPDFEEDDLYTELRKRLQKARETNVRDHEAEQLWDANLSSILAEDRTNGSFTLAGEAVFMEHRRKLFRWRPGETEWHYTGLEDGGELSPLEKGFALATLDDTIYAGKREGDLFRSLDGGDTWKNITESLVFPFAYFKGIIYVGSTVYISTDAGVMRSHDGENWCALTDIDGYPLLMDQIATDGSALYGVCGSGVYQVDGRTNTWKQIAPEIPYTVTSLAVDGNTTLYVGTQHNGIFRFQRDN
jgi:RNA polymerase sigma factor (sigma-70 family)